jgi:hypothetical protein
MNKLIKTVLFFLFIIPSGLKAQFFSDGALPDSNRVLSSVSKSGLRFDGLAFFKNNEYFHPLVEGYTLPGFHLQPRFYYDLNDKFSLEAGVHLSQFSGRKGLNSVDPLFRATYTPVKSFSILLGWLKGTTAHQLIEPLYQWERMYTHPLEYGVQFLVNNPGFKLDTWIDWERYIELNDPFQEELTFGTTSRIRLLEQDALEIWLPVQMTIRHMGGQVIAVDRPLSTLANWATGLNISLYRSSSLLKRLLLDVNYIGFSDFSPQKRQPFKNGYGLYPVLSANVYDFQASVGYWNSIRFMSPKGEPLFQSVSATNPSVIYSGRMVMTYKASYYKQVFRNVSFAAYFEAYQDIKLSQFDYAYGISMSVNGDLLLK